jgi:hypothetical protein
VGACILARDQARAGEGKSWMLPVLISLASAVALLSLLFTED